MNELPLTPAPSKKFDSKNILVIVLSVMLVALAVLFFIQRNDHIELTTQLNNEKDAIQSELQMMVSNYDSIKTDNEELSEDLTVAQAKTKNLLMEIEQVKRASYEEITSYRNQVNTLRGVMRNLYNQIDSLNERNKALYAENQAVREQYTEVKGINEQLSKEKQDLEQTVKQAQILEAQSILVEGLSPNNRESNKVARIQKIQVSFTLGKNNTAPRGAKNLYIRIMRPDQLLLTQSEKDIFRFENLQIPFSAMREVNYEGMELPVNIFWDNTEHPRLIPGTYTVDIFADGYNIGTSTFVLRK
jgi:chromosome segregation ATPase